MAGPVSEFLARPGKRFRGRLVSLAWTLAGRRDQPPPALPLSVELLHAGSLIVDDIQDGSVQRRGRATLHRQVGVPIALNAGNWLYFWPLTLLADLGLEPQIELSLHRLIAAAVRRCHEGQALDLTARIGDLYPAEVASVCRLVSEWKTGSLMGMAAAVGAVAGGASHTFVSAVTTFGERLGVALQMQNDLSELNGAAGPLKHPEDLIHGRVTWPWAWAVAASSSAAFDALQVRGAKLSAGTGNAAALATDLLAVLGPTPHRRVAVALDEAFADLEATVGPHSALGGFRTETHRLFQTYA